MPNNRARYAIGVLAELIRNLPDGCRIFVDNLPYLAVVGWPEARENGSAGLQTRAVLWNGAMTIALDETTHEIYVVRQTRESPKGPIVTIELPGGGINEGDTPRGTAMAELHEETGVTTSIDGEWIQLYGDDGTHPVDGLVFTNQHAFLLLAGRKMMDPVDEDDTEVTTMPLSKLIEMDNRNEFRDPLSPYALRRAKDWLEVNRPDLLT